MIIAIIKIGGAVLDACIIRERSVEFSNQFSTCRTKVCAVCGHDYYQVFSENKFNNTSLRHKIEIGTGDKGSGSVE